MQNRIDAFITSTLNQYLFRMYWAIADHHYKRRHFKRSAAAFDEVNIRQLSKNKQRELRFKRGHSLFEEEKYEDARYDLFQVMKSDGDYKEAATYYFSHIAYLNDKPQVALEGFESIADHKDFVDIVPVYIAQTLHVIERLKTYGKLLKETNSLKNCVLKLLVL